LQYFFGRLAVAIALILLAACGNDSTENLSEETGKAQLTAATLGEQLVLDVSDYLALEQYKAADRENGEDQARICKACHSLDAGGRNMIGPALFGFFGKGVAEQAGYAYSPAMQEADFIWTPRALDAWLAQPGRFLPGNRMTFGGLLKQQDRDDLIAYLLVTTTADSSE
jgi:cytochrome c